MAIPNSSIVLNHYDLVQRTVGEIVRSGASRSGAGASAYNVPVVTRSDTEVLHEASFDFGANSASGSAVSHPVLGKVGRLELSGSASESFIETRTQSDLLKNLMQVIMETNNYHVIGM